MSTESKLKNSTITYSGKLSKKPFDFNLDIDLSKIELAKIFNNNSIFFELLKTQLFFNENLNANISLNTKFPKKDQTFNRGKFNFNIVNGTINFNQTKLINDKIGSLEVVNSLLYFDENKFEAVIIKSFHFKKVTNFLSPLSTLQMLDKVNTLKAC